MRVDYVQLCVMAQFATNRNCFVESMLASGSLHQGMYNVLQEWYDFICCNIHIQADLIGKHCVEEGVENR